MKNVTHVLLTNLAPDLQSKAYLVQDTVDPRGTATYRTPAQADKPGAGLHSLPLYVQLPDGQIYHCQYLPVDGSLYSVDA